MIPARKHAIKTTILCGVEVIGTPSPFAYTWKLDLGAMNETQELSIQRKEIITNAESRPRCPLVRDSDYSGTDALFGTPCRSIHVAFSNGPYFAGLLTESCR